VWQTRRDRVLLKPGAYANVLAVDGAPLPDLEAPLEVRCVLKGGVEGYPTVEQHRPKLLGGCSKIAYRKTGSDTGLAFETAL
jgi:hypothetical protein